MTPSIPKSLRLFIKNCLLFRSTEFAYWILGSIAWMSIAMLVFVIFKLFTNE